MTDFPARGQKAPAYWDTQLKAYIDEHDQAIQDQVDDLSDFDLSACKACATDGSFGLPAPTGVGFEAIITGNALQDFKMNGTTL